MYKENYMVSIVTENTDLILIKVRMANMENIQELVDPDMLENLLFLNRKHHVEII